MARQIWTGPVLGTDRARLIDRCAELIESGRTDSFLYITASRPLLNLVTDALLDGRRIRGVWGTLPVFLFHGFASRVLETAIERDSELPVAPRIAIDRQEMPLRRSLVSQIVKWLSAEGRLNAIKPLAQREGSIVTLSNLIGEIERAAKTPSEFESIVEARRAELHSNGSGNPPAVHLQSDYDREVALIYRRYTEALDRFRFTEDDAGQLHALEVLRGIFEGKDVVVEWLREVRLLVVDGFFDFTPAQGEMLRILIPQIPDVIVNLNSDEANPAIFSPFGQTVRQLQGMADFEVCHTGGREEAGALGALRARLFNPDADVLDGSENGDATSPMGLQAPGASAITISDCADRETEIRRIAKEIKALVSNQGFRLRDIALVVRQRDAYDQTIARVMRDEQIPCARQNGVPLAETSAVRAALKLFRVMDEQSREPDAKMKMSELAGVIKSDYFRPSREDLLKLRSRFSRDNWALLADASSEIKRSSRAGLDLLGRWDVDGLENVIAFVGSELRLEGWLKRARQLSAAFREGVELESEDGVEEDGEPDDDQSESEESESGQEAVGDVARITNADRRWRPSRDVHPAAIAWSAALVEHLSHVIRSAPREGAPRQLRDGVIRLLDRLRFADQINGLIERATADSDTAAMRQAALELRGLEGIRRALNAAIKAVEVAASVLGTEDTACRTGLWTYLDETVRAIRAQLLVEVGADADGLRVLEATDVRGLRFRALFVAGLIEGGFPLQATRDWLYPHEEREQLKRYGLTLEDISPETLLKEEHYFYQAACRATDRLYLSRPLVLEDGSETVASYYIEELKRAAASGTCRSEVVRRDFDGRAPETVSTARELAVFAIRQDERRRHGANGDGLLSEKCVRKLMYWALERGYFSPSADARIAIERQRAGKLYGRFDGRITAPDLKRMSDEDFGSRHVYSASELGLYGKCPYKFFAQRVLKLEPRGEAALDLTALDAGSLLHEILRRLLSQYRNRRLTSLDRQELAGALARVADEVFGEHEQKVPPLNPNVWRIDRAIREMVLDQFLSYELELERKTEGKEVRPAYFELAFGMNRSESDPASTDETVELDRGTETIRLRGQIDRVDVARDGTAVAFDYKLSRGATLDDMSEGRDVSLHIYLAALERVLLRDREIAGAGYYILRGGERGHRRGLYRQSKGGYTGVTGTKSTLSDDEWLRLRREMQSRIFEFVDGMRAARFDVAPSAPKQTCSVCDYGAVCRYDKFRIGYKTAKPTTESPAGDSD